MGYLYDFAGLKEIIDYYNERVNSGDLDMRFLIVGDGGIYSSLKKHVAQIGADWVILTGRVPYFEITEYIELADLCLLSFAKNEITKEITPIKLIEYMAMGKPVLSNSLPGVFDEIGKDKGVIFANNQIELIKKIEKIYYEKHKLNTLGDKAQKFVKKSYTWDKIMKKFKKYALTSMFLKY
jgi:glycosyltransferase involved in cell wall biosynthesis